MRTMTTTAEMLADVPFFALLDADERAVLAERVDRVKFVEGDVIFKTGDPGDAMYVVISGEVEVLKRSRSGVDARVAVLGPSDWFGEMSIVDIQPRSATVRALAPGRLVRVSPADLDTLYRHDLRAYAIVILNLARELSRRLRVADGIVADLVANVLESYVKRPRAGGS